jgi:hypothetical protein
MEEIMSSTLGQANKKDIETKHLYLVKNVRRDRAHEGTASGVCHFDSATKSGHCEFTSGTGSLAGFHANLAGVALGGNDYSLAGPYWFAHGHENDADSHA